MENPDQNQSQPAAPPRRSWLGRNWRWFVPAVLLGGAVLCGGCSVGVFFTLFVWPRSTEPYQMALERVQADPQVSRQLGDPIEESGWLLDAKTYTENDRGFDFDVAGPNGKAHVHAEARRLAGQWGLTRVVVTPEDGERIVLDVTSGEGPNQAPRFQP